MATRSQSSAYAISALACLAENPQKSMLVREIAELAEVPAPYLAKLIGKLAAAGLVEAKRGYTGGVKLTRDPRSISLLEIVGAIDGETIPECLLGIAECSDQRSCPMHKFLQQNRLEGALRETMLTTVSDFQRQTQKASKRARKTSPRARS